MPPKDADGIANSPDPDQTAPLFAQFYQLNTIKGLLQLMSKNLGNFYNCFNHPKIHTRWPYYRVMPLKDAEEMASSECSDQTAPLHCFLSGTICLKIYDHYYVITGSISIN